MPASAPGGGFGGGGARGAGEGWPDWRDAGDYAWLLDASRPAFAWEWLRRSDEYRDCWGDAFARFGLLGRVDPCLDARVARPLWSASVDRSVLSCVVGGAGDCFDIAVLGGLASMVGGDEVEQWLLSDGLRSLRVDLLGGTLGAGPVPLRFFVDGLVSGEPVLLALRRLSVVARTGRFGGSLFAREPRADRWVLALRVCDALRAGAGQREIAGVLFDVSSARWRVAAPSFRLRVQRLVGLARRSLIAGPAPWLT